MYAVLELVNNSLRAMREIKAGDPIRIRFQAEVLNLKIDIRDSGGGFDPSRLPYNLNDPVECLNINGNEFQEYRNKHNNTRFGMGLYIAKRSFDEFNLSFIDRGGESRPWGTADIVGTHIQLRLKLGGPACLK